jgi:hypothetical protein
MGSTMSNRTPQPAFRAYTVAAREGQSDFWSPIGAAFQHHDSAGFNVVLQALPIDGRIVLRPIKERRSETG